MESAERPAHRRTGRLLPESPGRGRTSPPLNGGDRRLGIDLGINNIAACSDNTFYNSKQLKNVKGRYRYLKAELQSIGTRSARLKLKEVSGRERRSVRDLNHCVAKEIVNKPFDVFVFEDLTDIRENKGSREFNHKLGNWSFSRLIQFAQYKAEALGKQLVVIDPRHASQTCSKCGHVSPNNRDGREFTCIQCGFTLDADLNADRLRVSEPNAASGEAEGHKAIEAELSRKPVSLPVGS